MAEIFSFLVIFSLFGEFIPLWRIFSLFEFYSHGEFIILWWISYFLLLWWVFLHVMNSICMLNYSYYASCHNSWSIFPIVWIMYSQSSVVSFFHLPSSTFRNTDFPQSYAKSQKTSLLSLPCLFLARNQNFLWNFKPSFSFIFFIFSRSHSHYSWMNKFLQFSLLE